MLKLIFEENRLSASYQALVMQSSTIFCYKNSTKMLQISILCPWSWLVCGLNCRRSVEWWAMWICIHGIYNLYYTIMYAYEEAKQGVSRRIEMLKHSVSPVIDVWFMGRCELIGHLCPFVWTSGAEAGTGTAGVCHLYSSDTVRYCITLTPNPNTMYTIR